MAKPRAEYLRAGGVALRVSTKAKNWVSVLVPVLVLVLVLVLSFRIVFRTVLMREF